MNAIFKSLIANSFKKLGLAVARADTVQRLLQRSAEAEKLEKNMNILKYIGDSETKKLIQYFDFSRSQNNQDLMVLLHSNFKRNGFFVEFGATNGIELSNTFLLEKEFGWRGILAEPAVCWHDELKKNRKCHIDNSCVWKYSNCVVTFNQSDNAALSTIDIFSDADLHAAARKRSQKYEVNTISLNDLLKKYSAPAKIDYLSIDTEGSEYDILSNFDFKNYSFDFITCEHNYTPMRESINSLLYRNGYRRILEEISLFDDWYIHQNFVQHD